MGGWVIPPNITQAGKIIPNIKPKKGINTIDYNTFKIITTHALFIKNHDYEKYSNHDNYPILFELPLRLDGDTRDENNDIFLKMFIMARSYY